MTSLTGGAEHGSVVARHNEFEFHEMATLQRSYRILSYLQHVFMTSDFHRTKISYRAGGLTVKELGILTQNLESDPCVASGGSSMKSRSMAGFES